MKIQASHVVTQAGAVLSPGWVQWKQDRIVAVQEGEVSDADLALDNAVLAPGLVNAHCHLDYTHFRRQTTRGRSFAEWIAEMNELKFSCERAEFIKAVQDGMSELVDYGTTSAVVIESFPEIIETIEVPIRVWWAIEGIDVRRPFEFPDPLPALGAVSPHAPYTASPELYREAKKIAQATGALFTTHIAETIEESEMFYYGSGPLFDLLKNTGRDMSDCGNGSPLGMVLDEFMLPDRAVLAHCNHFDNEDLARLWSAGHSVVHCPQTHEFFCRAPFQWERLAWAEIPVALGTDSLASADRLSLFEEMSLFLKNQATATPQQVLDMVTTVPAKMLGMSGTIGVLHPGASADMIAVPLSDPDPILSLVSHPDTVPLVVAGGRFVRVPEGAEHLAGSRCP